MFELKVICVLLGILDYRSHKLANWIMYPLILATACSMPFNNTLFCVLAWVYSVIFCRQDYCGQTLKRGIWYGGDVKLFAWYGAAFGLNGLLLTICCSLIIILINKKFSGKPVAPLAAVISLLIT